MVKCKYKIWNLKFLFWPLYLIITSETKKINIINPQIEKLKMIHLVWELYEAILIEKNLQRFYQMSI